MLGDIIIGIGISYILLFVLSIFLQDNSIADIFWGLGFFQVALHSVYLSPELLTSQLFLVGIIGLWALRISGYILSKKLLSPGEDRRYVKWRKEWKWFYVRSFVQIYLLQMVLLLIVATPIMVFNFHPVAMNTLIVAGLTIAIAGLVIESVADWQLYFFVKTKKKGEIMRSGLWKYSRHPNYFGESVFWLGISILGASVSWAAFTGFIVITTLLRFVSGVPLAEEGYKNNKNYQEYAKITPAFFPRFFHPKRPG
ncbi:MAG: DUF1295 domain-containing protein [Desulforhopalus sp.]